MSITEKKLVIDTNIFIAVIARKSPYRWIFDKILSGEFILCISNEIILEYEEILIEKTSKEVAQNIVDFITVFPYVEKTEIYYSWGLISKDADDNKFVDCAISSGAYCIVSNDKHFKVLKQIDFPEVKVLTIQEFERMFKNQ